MRRTRLYQILICLLCLFPVWSQAQSLTQYEYWFDDNFSARKSAGLSGYEADIDVGIDASRLGNGLHKLCLRVQQSDGMYSPVTTHYFFKAQVSNGGKLEYWFDGNRKKINTVDCHVSSDGEAYLYTSGLDLNAITPGYHTMYYRFTNDDGTTSSAVSTASVIVTSNLSNGGKLEYWFDDDRENVSTVDGKVASSGDAIIFNSDLDLKEVSQGMHRMYYRLVDAKGKPNSAVSMTPIMVKSKYNVANPEALTVTEQAYWFDDEEPEVRIVSGPKNSRDLPLTLDARKLSDGKHTLHLQYGNSANVWNGAVDFPFTKEKVEPPMIIANSSEKDGEVTLTFTSIPYGQVYTVVRKYPSGTERKVEDIKTTEHPTVLKFIDKAGPGTYTYYIKGKYFDVDGVLQEVLSKEMSVTVDNVSSDVKRGTISGLLTFEGKETQKEDYYDYTIFINGKSQRDADYNVRRLKRGNFKIENVPYNTEITIGIENDYYYFKDVKLVVNETTCNHPHYFNGTKNPEVDDSPEDEASDIILTENIRVTPSAWEMEVRNKSSKPWSGNLIVKVISKSVKEYYDKAKSPEGLSAWNILFHPKAYYKDDIFLKTVANMHVTIQGKNQGSQVLALDIIDMPENDKAEDYYVYVFSKKDGTGLTKLIEAYEEDGYEYTHNPQTLNFNPYDFSVDKDFDIRDYEAEVKMLIMHIKRLSKWGDPFELEMNLLGDDPEEIFNNYMKRTVDVDGTEKFLFVNGSQMGGWMLYYYLKDYQKEIRKDAKTAKETLNSANEFNKLCGTLEGFYNGWKVDDNHKFFETAKQVFKYCEKVKIEKGLDKSGFIKAFPALAIYQRYFEVGEEMVKNIEALSNQMDAPFVFNKLASGKGVYNIKVRKYTGKKSDKRYFSGSEFFSPDGHPKHTGQIRSINFKLVNPVNGATAEGTMNPANVEIDSDGSGITIKNVEFNAFQTEYFKNYEAWMIITWNNNRVIHVPLLDKQFVKLVNSNNEVDPVNITVELQSETYMNVAGIANNLTFVEP